MWGAAGVWSGKKEDERQTHRGEESSAHAPRRRRRQRRYNLELCTGGMWQYHGYVLRAPWATHGMGTAYAYVENAERASGTPASAHVPRWKGERRVCAGPGVPRGKDTRDSVSRSGRRVLRGIFCIWICRICQVSQATPSFLSRAVTGARGRLLSSSICSSILGSLWPSLLRARAARALLKGFSEIFLPSFCQSKRRMRAHDVRKWYDVDNNGYFNEQFVNVSINFDILHTLEDSSSDNWYAHFYLCEEDSYVRRMFM